MIISKDLLDQKLIDSAQQGLRMVDKGIITEAHLGKVLESCKRTGLGFSESLKMTPPDFDDDDDDDLEIAENKPPEQEGKGFLGGLFGKFKK